MTAPWARLLAAVVPISVVVASLQVDAGCTKDEGSVAAFCREVRVVPPLASVVSGFTEADQDGLARRLDDASAAYGRLADAAPGSVRHEVDDMVSLVDAVLTAVRGNGGDAEATAADIRKAVAAHTSAAASSATVAAYARRHCEVDLNPTVPPDETSSTTSSTTGAEGSTTTTVGGG